MRSNEFFLLLVVACDRDGLEGRINSETFVLCNWDISTDDNNCLQDGSLGIAKAETSINEVLMNEYAKR